MITKMLYRWEWYKKLSYLSCDFDFKVQSYLTDSMLLYHTAEIDVFAILVTFLHIHVLIRTPNVLPANRLETLLRRITPLIPGPILPHSLLASPLVLLKVLDLVGIHVLHHRISLPLLEAEPKALMAVILIVDSYFSNVQSSSARIQSQT